MRLISLLGMLVTGLVLAPVAAWAQPANAPTSAATSANGADVPQSAKAAALVRDFAFAPSDASMVGGIRLSNILKSELAATGLAEARKSNPDQAMMIGMGMGVLSEIKEVRFALVDKSVDKSMAKSDKPVAAPTPADFLNQTDVVMLISGKIDDGMLALLTSAHSGAAKDPNAKVSAPTVAFRRIDADTVLVGTAPLLTDAVERLNRSRDASVTSVKSSVLESRAVAQRAALQEDHDFWISGRIPDVPMTAGVGASVKGFAVGLSLAAAGAPDAGLVEMAVDAGNDLLADSFIKMIRDAIAQQKQWAGLVETSVDHTTIRVRAKLPKDLATLAAGAMGGTPTASGAATRPSTLAPAPAQPQKVRIIGLEEGERQVPLR